MTETPQPTKFCVNCKHHGIEAERAGDPNVCKRTYTDNPVTGHRKFIELSCEEERGIPKGPNEFCGPSGRFFEPKPSSSAASFYDR